jgi:LmbE family N-acetylglucosaminyl deacetylase
MNTHAVLPAWDHVVAVVAHPDDESFGLGAVLAAFVAAGSEVSVLCLTRGEASTLHAVAGDLAQVRADELRNAALVLGIVRVSLGGFPDGGLSSVPIDVLVDEVASFTDRHPVDGIVVFDSSGITGHQDHQRATQAALAYARVSNVPVLAWTLPEPVAAALRAETGAPFSGHGVADIDIAIDVDRTTQERAVACHPSQAVPGSVLWRRLELLGPREHLRWLHHAHPSNDPVTTTALDTEKKEAHA